MHQFNCTFFTMVLASSVGNVHAATIPPTDSGRLLQDTKNSQSITKPMQQLNGLPLYGSPLSESTPGGEKILLNKFNVFGNTIFDYDQLLAVLGTDTQGKKYDLAELQNFANQISIFYRDNGYPFARAFIPAQELNSGELTIGILEGLYGEVRTTGDHSLSSVTQGFLMNIQPDMVIDEAKLERSMLLLSDQPGVDVVPVIQPGKEVGKGDLMVSVQEGKRFALSAGLDNMGNRYSGSRRATIDLNASRLLTVGDILSLNLFRTDEETWLGQAKYEMPIGFSGLRASFGYSYLNYSLGGEFEDSNFSGTATTRSFELSYPLIRSLSRNVTALGKYNMAKYSDKRFGLIDKKDGDSVQFGIQFDNRDSFYSGGITYGNILKVEGDINHSSGVGFDSFSLYKGQLSRQQNIPGNFSLFANLSGQYTDKSIDGSEQLALGGISAVRAYAPGEGSGSKTLVGQIELRSQVDNYHSFVFYDLGKRFNVGAEEVRKLAGAGVGVRYQSNKFNVELISAWKTTENDSLSDNKQKSTRIWFKTGIVF
jgi:hemolysin activation/secretion protein